MLAIDASVAPVGSQPGGHRPRKQRSRTARNHRIRRGPRRPIRSPARVGRVFAVGPGIDPPKNFYKAQSGRPAPKRGHVTSRSTRNRSGSGFNLGKSPSILSRSKHERFPVQNGNHSQAQSALRPVQGTLGESRTLAIPPSIRRHSTVRDETSTNS